MCTYSFYANDANEINLVIIVCFGYYNYDAIVTYAFPSL